MQGSMAWFSFACILKSVGYQAANQHVAGFSSSGGYIAEELKGDN